MTAALVKLLQQVVVRCQVNASQSVLVTDFGYAPCTELIECVEAQPSDAVMPEMRLIVFVDDLLDELVLGLCHRSLTAFPYQHDEVFQKSQLLDIPFLSLYLKGIHRDGMLFSIGYVFATEIFAQSLVGVSRIDQHDVGVLLMGLAYHGIDVKTLAAA